MPKFSCIFAVQGVGKNKGGIGYKNSLPWKIREDMEFFRMTTTACSNKENIVIMGRKTMESFNNLPLPRRVNLVVSKNDYPSLDSALKKAEELGNRNIFVIGGSKLLQEAYRHKDLERIYITEVLSEYECDVFFREYEPDNTFKVVKEESKNNIRIRQFNKIINSTETSYLRLMNHVLTEGELRRERTGVGTLSIFNSNLSFDLSESFPLFTTKALPLRIIFEELMWFLRGESRVSILQSKGVYIWNGNSSKAYMNQIGLGDYPEGEIGVTYGPLWRNFGGKHDFEDESHIGKGGIDQITEVINEIKINPTSRRLLVTAWNPLDLKKVALPPCHYSFQFFVRKGEYLDCKFNMRSWDLFLGAPFNIASYALLTYMISALTSLKPGKLHVSSGDTHIYSNHIFQVKEQLTRPVREFPRLSFLEIPEKIEDWKYEYIKLEGYTPHPPIKADMAV